MDEFYGDLENRDILKEKKKDDNLELHHKLITSFWLAAVAWWIPRSSTGSFLEED